MISLRLLAISLVAATAVSLAPLTAFAKTCASDTECSANQKCQVVGGTSSTCASCPSGAECPPCDTTTTVEKGCVDQPIGCTTDKDCPAYLSCVAEDSGPVSCPPCAPDQLCPPCEAPAPTGKKICDFREKACTTSAECASGLECRSSGSQEDCATAPPPCAGGACPPPQPVPECPSKPAANSCQFKVISCVATSDCPADFTCETVTEGSCSGSSGGGTRTGSGSSGGTSPTPPAPNPDSPAPAPTPQGGEPPPGSGGCTTTTLQVCIPKGIGFGQHGGGIASTGSGFGAPEASRDANGKGKPAATPGAPGPVAEGTTSGGGSDDGCSVVEAGSASNRGGPASLALAAAAALFGISRSRRRSS